ncbi:MAG: T9SS type A sorting domain-containing protein [Flavobacteriales bacterium]|nr:T9SS type A sorting domain-containing protein [Flavobacteriales bacterium]
MINIIIPMKTISFILFCFLISNICFSQKPDLVFASSDVNPSTVNVKEKTTLTFTVKNQGNASAGACYASIWLSKNQTFDGSPTDIYLTDRNIPGLSAGATSGNLGGSSITIPTGLPSNGTWYIMIGLDATSLVNESNEGNNQMFKTIAITIPDLIVINQNVSQTNITAGSTISAYCKEANQGSGTVASNVVSVHLSANNILTPGANGDEYLADINISSFSGSNSAQGSSSVKIPSTTPSGNYYIFFSADGSQIIYESSETNNYATVQVTVNGCSYNLSSSTKNFDYNGGSSSVNINTSNGCQWTASSPQNWINITSGSSGKGNGTISYTVSNNPNTSPRYGTISAGGRTLEISQDALSCNYNLSTSGVSLTNSLTYSSSFNVTTNQGCSWTASSTDDSWLHTNSVGNGDGKIDYYVDENTKQGSRSASIIVENKSFNVYQPGKAKNPDLKPIAVNLVGTEFNWGEEIQVNVEVSNIEAASADNLTIRFWISENTGGTIDKDFYVAQSSPISINGNSTQTVSVKFTIPKWGKLAGSKYLKCWVDFIDNIKEENENNNILHSKIEITGQIFTINDEISHLAWPFYNSSNTGSNGILNDNILWQENYSSNGPQNGGWGWTTHSGHNNWEKFAQDWSLEQNTCEKHFFSPLNGTIVRIVTNTCLQPCASSNSKCGNGFGNHIAIRSSTNPNYLFLVGHFTNANSKLKQGDLVAVGDFLGDIGSTGNSSGPHAHVQLNKGLIEQDFTSIRNGNYSIAAASDNRYAAEFQFDATYGFPIGGGNSKVLPMRSESFKIVPNPTYGRFTILNHTQFTGEIRITVLDLMGKSIQYSTYRDGEEMQINLDTPNGVYLIRIECDNKVGFFKVIKNSGF